MKQFIKPKMQFEVTFPTEIHYKDPLNYKMKVKILHPGTIITYQSESLGYANITLPHDKISYFMENYRLRDCLADRTLIVKSAIERPPWLKVIHCESESMRILRSNIEKSKNRELLVKKIRDEENQFYKDQQPKGVNK